MRPSWCAPFFFPCSIAESYFSFYLIHRRLLVPTPVDFPPRQNAADTAARIDEIVAPDLEARQRNLALQNRQKVNTSAVGFGSSTTTLRKKVETVG